MIIGTEVEYGSVADGGYAASNYLFMWIFRGITKSSSISCTHITH
jgi:hypothetical protein